MPKATQHSTQIFWTPKPCTVSSIACFPKCVPWHAHGCPGREWGSCWWTNILGNIELSSYLYIQISRGLNNLFCESLMVKTGMPQHNLSTVPVCHKTLH